MEQQPMQGEILLYDNGGEKAFVSVVFRDETFWLTQKATQFRQRAMERYLKGGEKP